MTGTPRFDIKTWRTSVNMTQQDVADILGVSKPTVVSWEKGDVKPKGLVVYALAKLFEIEVENIKL